MKGESQNGKKSKRILILFINLAYEEIAFMENKSLLWAYDSFKNSIVVNFYISDLIAPIIWKGPSNIFWGVKEVFFGWKSRPSILSLKSSVYYYILSLEIVLRSAQPFRRFLGTHKQTKTQQIMLVFDIFGAWKISSWLVSDFHKHINKSYLLYKMVSFYENHKFK